MIKIDFTEEEIEQLRYQRFHHVHPRVQLKMEVLLLKSKGLKHKEICEIADIHHNTLTSYLQEYIGGGIDALKVLKFHRPQSELNEYRQSIEDEFRNNPPASIKEASARIKEMTGIQRSDVQVAKYLKSIGLKRRKAAQVPAKADTEKQAEFLEQELNPRLEEAKAGKRQLFFVDAVHFVMSAFLGYLWCFSRIFIKSPSGRQRYNVLGALNAITLEIETVTNDSYINALSVIELMNKLVQADSDIPITLVLDNARYQKCKAVTEFAEKHKIELLYLPSYSPNLNLIERLWKLVKKNCLYCKYYDTFSSFKGAIDNCLADLEDKTKDQLVTLMTLKFQVLK